MTVLGPMIASTLVSLSNGGQLPLNCDTLPGHFLIRLGSKLTVSVELPDVCGCDSDDSADDDPLGLASAMRSVLDQAAAAQQDRNSGDEPIVNASPVAAVAQEDEGGPADVHADADADGGAHDEIAEQNEGADDGEPSDYAEASTDASGSEAESPASTETAQAYVDAEVQPASTGRNDPEISPAESADADENGDDDWAAPNASKTEDRSVNAASADAADADETDPVDEQSLDDSDATGPVANSEPAGAEHESWSEPFQWLGDEVEGLLKALMP